MIQKIIANFYTSRSKLVPKNQGFLYDVAKITNNHNGIVAELSKILNGTITRDVSERRIRYIAFM